MAPSSLVVGGGGSSSRDVTDDPACRLFGPTALVVQAVMGVLVLTSLVYKRHRESPRRKWKIWMFDVSKQVIGQAMLHGSNVFVSWLIGKRSLSNPCVSYFLNILLDTTLGVLIIYSLLQIFTHLLTEKAQMTGLKSGVYGDPPSPTWWLKQAAVYLFCLFIMKTIVIVLIEVFPFLMTAGKWLLSWTKSKNSVQVIFVMGVFPIAMNILQFWLIDSIVKFKSSFVDIEPGASPEDREPLVNENFDDLDDEDDADTRTASTVHISPRNPSIDIERGGSIRTRPGSASSKTFPSALSKEGTTEDRDAASSAPTSTSSRTIKPPPKRRSPPPSPSTKHTPSSSYGSIGDSGAAIRDRWRVRDEEDDEHAKWGRELGYDDSGEVGNAWKDESGRRSRSPAAGTGTGTGAGKRWESWNMPVMMSPPASTTTGTRDVPVSSR